MEYAVRLATATRAPRPHGMPELERYITYGASPRASINLILTARALAFVRGRDYALPQDVLDMARDVMRHRLVLSFEALSDNVTADDVLTTVLKRIPVPVVPLRERSTSAPAPEAFLWTASSARGARPDDAEDRAVRGPSPRLSGSSSASTGRSSAGWTALLQGDYRSLFRGNGDGPGRTCASTSPATTSGTSTGTSPRGWTRPTSASTSRTARSRPGSCWT